MIKIIAAALFTVLACSLAVFAMPSTVVAASAPVQPSFDFEMPAPQAPFDETVITAVETVGASRTD